MARYTEQEIQQLLSISIVDIMRHLGKDVEHRGNMYHSPFREDDTPSFSIKESTNEWYDFGTGEGGGLIAFVCKIANCERKDAYDWLASYKNLIPESNYTPLPRKERQDKESQIAIDSTSSTFTRTALIKYAEERCVPRNILEKYCEEVFYHIKSKPDKQYFAIGFRNNSGGYALRSSYAKISTGNAATTFGPDGKRSLGISGKKAYVFEGFFDFMSYLAYSGLETPGHDCCVLNSVTNLDSVLNGICEHDTIACFTDNDKAGRETMEKIIETVGLHSPSAKVYDMASLYDGHKDINEKILSEKE